MELTEATVQEINDAGSEEVASEEEEDAPEPPQKRQRVKDTFDLQSRQLFLTYPQCEVTKEDALLQLSEKVGTPEEYLIAQEKHQVDLFPWPGQGFVFASDYIQYCDTRSYLMRMTPELFKLNFDF